MQELIDTIFHGNSAESKRAKFELIKLYDERSLREKLNYLFIDNFKQVVDNDNYQGIANFIYSAKWIIFFCPEKHFKAWLDFLLSQAISPSGIVRNAVVKSFPNLLFSMDFSRDFLKKPNAKDLKLMKKYWQLANSIEDLLVEFSDDKYDKYEYVSDLPPSVYKSLNYLWTDLNYYRKGEKLLKYYNDHVLSQEEKFLDNNSSQLTVLLEFESYLKLNKIKLNIEDIVDIIYQEKTDESLKMALSHICNQTQVSAQMMSQILEYLNTMWHIFPHFDLNGLAPLDLINKKKYE